MQKAQWLGGAFSAYGLAGAVGKGGRSRIKISLMTSSDASEYVEAFHTWSGLGRVEPYKGRWHWICDDPVEVKTFHLAVGPHLIPEKRKMIEASWEVWRSKMIDVTDAEVDPGPIDGDPIDPDEQP